MQRPAPEKGCRGSHEFDLSFAPHFLQGNVQILSDMIFLPFKYRFCFFHELAFLLFQTSSSSPNFYFCRLALLFVARYFAFLSPFKMGVKNVGTGTIFCFITSAYRSELHDTFVFPRTPFVLTMLTPACAVGELALTLIEDETLILPPN